MKDLTFQNNMKIQTANLIKGKINLSGDKSISHRAAIFSALSDGNSQIKNFSKSLDCSSTLNCLRDLGVRIEQNGSNVSVEGLGKQGFTKPKKPLDCGNSGTTARLLAGVLAGQNFESILTGDESLKSRPMKRIIEPLKLMGAKIESKDGCLPLKIYGSNSLNSISYDLPVASAQVKSCILLAGLNAKGVSKVQSPKSKVRLSPSRNHTELMLRYLGANIAESFIATGKDFIHQVSIDGDSNLTAKDLNIPGDISSASFFMVAATCLENSEIIIENVGLNPTRSAIIEVLQSFGTEIEILNKRENCNEISGDLRVFNRPNSKSKIYPNKIDDDIIGNLIDEIPILAILGTQLENGLEIRSAKELRFKETDRISAVVKNLPKMNAKIEEFTDGFRIEKSELKGAKVESFGDHRIAMAFAVAGLLADGKTEILNSECVNISFPDFFEILSKVVK